MNNVITLSTTDTHAVVASAKKATRKASRANREQRIADLNNAIVECGFNVALQEGITANVVRELQSLYKAGSFDFTTTRRRFHCGYMAYRLKAAPSPEKVTPAIIAKMEAILEKPNAASTSADRRTADQEKAYGASRFAWRSILKRAGIETEEKRGKGSAGRAGATGKAKAANAKATKEAEAETASSTVATTTEAPAGGITNAYELATHVRRTLSDLLQCAKKRAKYQGAVDLQRIISTALNETAKLPVGEYDGAPTKERAA